MSEMLNLDVTRCNLKIQSATCPPQPTHTVRHAPGPGGQALRAPPKPATDARSAWVCQAGTCMELPAAALTEGSFDVPHAAARELGITDGMSEYMWRPPADWGPSLQLQDRTLRAAHLPAHAQPHTSSGSRSSGGRGRSVAAEERLRVEAPGFRPCAILCIGTGQQASLEYYLEAEEVLVQPAAEAEKMESSADQAGRAEPAPESQPQPAPGTVTGGRPSAEGGGQGSVPPAAPPLPAGSSLVAAASSGADPFSPQPLPPAPGPPTVLGQRSGWRACGMQEWLCAATAALPAAVDHGGSGDSGRGAPGAAANGSRAGAMATRVAVAGSAAAQASSAAALVVGGHRLSLQLVLAVTRDGCLRSLVAQLVPWRQHHHRCDGGGDSDNHGGQEQGEARRGSHQGASSRLGCGGRVGSHQVDSGSDTGGDNGSCGGSGTCTHDGGSGSSAAASAGAGAGASARAGSGAAAASNPNTARSAAAADAPQHQQYCDSSLARDALAPCSIARQVGSTCSVPAAACGSAATPRDPSSCGGSLQASPASASLCLSGSAAGLGRRSSGSLGGCGASSTCTFTSRPSPPAPPAGAPAVTATATGAPAAACLYTHVAQATADLRPRSGSAGETVTVAVQGPPQLAAATARFQEVAAVPTTAGGAAPAAPGAERTPSDANSDSQQRAVSPAATPAAAACPLAAVSPATKPAARAAAAEVPLAAEKRPRARARVQEAAAAAASCGAYAGPGPGSGSGSGPGPGPATRRASRHTGPFVEGHDVALGPAGDGLVGARADCRGTCLWLRERDGS